MAAVLRGKGIIDIDDRRINDRNMRLARQAIAEDRPELKTRSAWLRFTETAAAVYTDAIITHSNIEAKELAKLVPPAKAHTIRWSRPVRTNTPPFGQRRSLAFIGGYSHEPNLDAVRWLISEIMPIVHKKNPDIECLLVGSNMPDDLRKLCGKGIEPVGYVENLSEIFDKVRLTIAPLTFGAGIKGKVIESLSEGIPCVCTPVAAEGLELPGPLEACVRSVN